jgi:hypothetical protein
MLLPIFRLERIEAAAVLDTHFSDRGGRPLADWHALRKERSKREVR